MIDDLKNLNKFNKMNESSQIFTFDSEEDEEKVVMEKDEWDVKEEETMKMMEDMKVEEKVRIRVFFLFNRFSFQSPSPFNPFGHTQHTEKRKKLQERYMTWRGKSTIIVRD